MTVGLEERSSEFVTQSCGGKINVNWQALAALHRSRAFGESSATRIIDNILEFLKERKVLVYEGTPESYFGIGAGVPLNPKRSESDMKYSFADEQNAREYYSHFFRDALYGVILVKTIGVVQRPRLSG